MDKYKLQLLNSFDLELKGDQISVDQELSRHYKELNISYPKFYKMNTLCKLGFIGVEKLIQNHADLISENKNSTATIFANKASSLVSDYEHNRSLINGNTLPSPAVFVYTLPNILNGEIAIRHGLTGYNAFYIMNSFKNESIEAMILTGRYCQEYNYCLAGWVETDMENQNYSVKTMLYKVD